MKGIYAVASSIAKNLIGKNNGEKATNPSSRNMRLYGSMINDKDSDLEYLFRSIYDYLQRNATKSGDLSFYECQ